MTKLYLSLSRYLTVLLLLITTVAWSQSRTVTGKVTSQDDGTPVPGANIVEKGTNNGVSTDADGNFTINVGNNATLVISFVGYQSQEVAVGAQSSVSVGLNPDVTQLSEIVVIGYGETTVKDATGAVAAVRSEDFNGGLIASPEQLIQGKTAGVQITGVSGNPGDGVQIRIRGTTSIRSNNNPLFVVDGVPLSGGTQPASADLGFGSVGDTNPLNFLNPSDIESISILKDASATAIYGSRGANGVVIITTKKGKGAGTLEFSSNLTIASPANKYDLLEREAFLDAVEQYGGDRSARDSGSNTDWQDFITRTSVSHKQNLAYSRGFGTAVVRASLGYENQQGVVVNSWMKRLTGKVNVGKSFMDEKLNLDLTTTFSRVTREDPPISGNAGFQGDLLGAAYSANPTWPTDPDFNPGGQRSPANMLEYYRSTGATNRILASLAATYKFNDALSVKANYGLDRSKGDRVTLVSGEAVNAGNGVTGIGRGQLNVNENINNLLELTLNYNKKVGSIDINFVGGYSIQSFHNKWMWSGARGFDGNYDFDYMEDAVRNSTDAIDAVANGLYPIVNNWGVSNELIEGNNPVAAGGFASGIAADGTLVRSRFAIPAGVSVDGIAANFYDQTDYLQSYFGRGNFTINGKYLITATIRADGSSSFGEDNRYGIFPSAALAWQMHEEDFLPETFNTFKLRVGYGIVGNQDGLGYGNFKRRDRWGDAGTGDRGEITLPGPTVQGAVNPGLKWESTAQTAIGIDFGFLGDRLSGSVDYYNKQTTDLLLRYRAAAPVHPSQVERFNNLPAIVENKGWEVSLSYDIVDNSDAAFTISGNVAHNKNNVKDLAGVFNAGQIYGQGLSGAFAQRLASGYPLFSWYLREFEGFDEDGQPIGDNQTYVGKSALPTWNVGLSLNARYKKFDVAMYFAGQFGHYIYNNTRNGFFTAGSINNGRNVTSDVITSGESGSAEAAVSTRFLEKGDFFRMQNLQLGYNLIQGGSAIKALRLSFTAQNLFVITKYTGLDPEVSSSPASFNLMSNLPTAGIDYAAYPKPRTFTIGLNATF